MRKADALLALAVSAYLFSVPSIGLPANQCITEPKPSGPGEHWYYIKNSETKEDVNWRETLFQQFLQWRERQKQANSSLQQLDREALFREFVLWSILHRNTDRADNESR